jgi:hypothetical protein
MANRQLSKAELEASARALLGWPQPENEPESEPENEDRRMLLQGIEAQKHAHDPISEQTRTESLEKLVGKETAENWGTFHDQ